MSVQTVERPDPNRAYAFGTSDECNVASIGRNAETMRFNISVGHRTVRYHDRKACVSYCSLGAAETKIPDPKPGCREYEQESCSERERAAGKTSTRCRVGL